MLVGMSEACAEALFVQPYEMGQFDRLFLPKIYKPFSSHSANTHGHFIT
jgi:hypothetical protein